MLSSRESTRGHDASIPNVFNLRNGSSLACELPFFVAGRDGGQPPHSLVDSDSVSRPPLAFEIRSVLVVDDSHDLLKAVRRMFAANDVAVHVATTVAEALDLASRVAPDLAIVDVYLAGGGDGLDLVSSLRERNPKAVIGAISGAMCTDLEARCVGAGARWCLTKPFDRPALYEAITANGGPMPPTMRVDDTLEAMTFAYIDRVLAAVNGSKSAAAKVLGIPRQSLQRKLRMREARMRKPASREQS